MTNRIFAALAAALLASSAQAASFSYTGSFTQDNGKAGYSFTLGSAGTVTLTSLGYAGGTNAAGQTIAAGGFDPVFTLYNSSGFDIAEVDDGTGPDPVYSATLGAGTYTLYLTQYNNFGPASLPGFFAFDGQPNFRGGFVDFYGNERNGNWALDISGVDSVTTAAVPEPAAWALMLAGFGLVGSAARRRQRSVAA